MEKQAHIRYFKIRDTLLSLGFVLLLVFPFLQNWTELIPPMDSGENRALAEKPTLTSNNYEEFPTNYEAWFTDAFSLRNHLIAMKSVLVTDVLNKSPLPDKILFGKKGWMYLVTRELDEFRGNNQFSDAEIRTICREMLRRKSYLDSLDIKMYLVIAPTKYSIYPEYLPSYVDRLKPVSRTEKIKDALLESGIRLMDLRDTLTAYKDLGLLYYKTDNHWNDLGSLLATNAMLRLIGRDFPEVSPLDLDDYDIRTEDKADGNLGVMLNMKGRFKDTRYVLEPKFQPPAVEVEKAGYPIPEGFAYTWEFEMAYATGDKSLPKLLFIRDSFGTSIIPFMNQRFNKSVFIFDNWNYTSNEYIIEQEKPDLVVYLVLESLWRGFYDGIEVSKEKNRARIQPVPVPEKQ